MTFGDINYLAVLVAAIAYFVVGAIWYSPLLFSRQWVAAANVRMPEGQGPPVSLFVLSFIAYFVTALAMAFLAGAVGAATVGEGLLLGLITGVGFGLSVLLVTHAYEQRPASLWLINAGYNLIGFLVVGLIVSIWR